VWSAGGRGKADSRRTPALHHDLHDLIRSGRGIVKDSRCKGSEEKPQAFAPQGPTPLTLTPPPLLQHVSKGLQGLPGFLASNAAGVAQNCADDYPFRGWRSPWHFDPSRSGRGSDPVNPACPGVDAAPPGPSGGVGLAARPAAGLHAAFQPPRALWLWERPAPTSHRARPGQGGGVRQEGIPGAALGAGRSGGAGGDGAGWGW
jgi:hypothetical protein